MAKKRKTRRKSTAKKNGNSSMGRLLIVLVIIAVLAFAITYIITTTSQKDASIKESAKSENPMPEKVKDENQSRMANEGPTIKKGNIDGTWVSENDGSMLTIKGRDYTIELPNVDGTVMESGTVVVLQHQVTFVNTVEDADCTVSPGVYKYEVVENTIVFQKVEDKCKSRVSRLSANWFKI